MPRAIDVGFAIVAAFFITPAAAAPVVEDAPLAAQVVELAERFGIEPAHDRAHFIADLSRLLYPGPEVRPPFPVNARVPAAMEPGAPRAPLPLPASVWSRAVFHRTVPLEQLVATILQDRRATLLCRGLTALDDETLAYLADRPALVGHLYERAAAWFATFGESLRIRDGRVIAPGGQDAAPLWESVARASLASPEQFVRQLFTINDGRLAYVYAVVAAADPKAARFALGLWLPLADRVQRLQALVDACTRGYTEWRPDNHPFTRAIGDLEMLLVRIRLDASGAPAGPAERTFWGAAFDVDPNLSWPGGRSADGPVDAAWLVAASAEHDMYSRLDCLDQVAFAQRVFGDAAVDRAKTASIVRAYRPYKMLLLALERMGVRAADTYAAALHGAETATGVGSDRRFWAFSGYQGAVALVGRMRGAGTIDVAAADRLLHGLGSVSLQDGEYGGGLAQWVRNDLGRVLPLGSSWEERAAIAMSGPAAPRSSPRVSWEGQIYRLDLALAERQRLEIVRGKQGGHTLDLALTIDGLGRRLRASTVTVDEVHAVAAGLRAVASESGERLGRPPVNLLPPGVESPRDALEWVSTTADALAKITRPGDVRRASRLGQSLQQLGDVVLGNALLSIAYAASIGDPDGAALLAGNVALRHDFGLGRRDADGRTRLPWAAPRQDFQPGVPWHVTGSLLGLDLALSPLNLRRLSIDRLADAPTLSSLERDGLALTVGLMDPQRLTDADRDRIVAAVDRGRDRLRRIGTQTALDEVADLLRFDGWRRRAVSWQLASDPRALPEEFSLLEAFTLGGGAPDADLDAWGTPAIHTEGCACLRFPDPTAWRRLEGRPQLAMMAATMGDLNLAVAMVLRELRLPASMARTLLTMGLQDFIDDVRLSNVLDWQALSRQAQRLNRRRVEDYVSAAAAVNGPLTPVEEPGAPPQP